MDAPLAVTAHTLRHTEYLIPNETIQNKRYERGGRMSVKFSFSTTYSVLLEKRREKFVNVYAAI